MRVMRAARAGLVALVSVLSLAILLAISPQAALAHADLDSSTPAASSVLDTSPPVISLHFDEDIDVPLTSIQLFDQDGTEIALGGPQPGADGSMVQATVPTLSGGTYAVVWRVSSADGHIVAGAFSFQIGTAGDVDTEALIDTVLGGARAEPAVGRALGISRFAAFFGLVLLLGGLFMVMVLGPGPATGIDWPARRLLWIGWLLLIVGSAANFGLLGANAAAGTVADTLDTSLWSKIADTRTGGLIVARLGFVAAFLPVLVNIAQRQRTWWRVGVVGLGLLTIVTFSGAGHSSVEANAAVWIGIDAVHLAFIALWIGSLAMIAIGGRAWLRDEHHSSAVHRFSRMATIAVPLIVVTGVTQTWRIGGGLSTLTDTTWGRLLLAKGAVAVLLVTIGGASRWLLMNSGPGALRRTVIAEGLLGIAVLGLAAGLVGSPPTVAPQSRLFTASLTEAGVIVDVSITPGHVGSNEVHMVVTPPGGNLNPVADLTARMALPSRDVPFVPVTITADSSNHYTGNVTLPFAGDWKLEIIVAPEPSQSVLLSSTVPIPG